MSAAQIERKRIEHSMVSYLTDAASSAVVPALVLADMKKDTVSATLPEQTVAGTSGFKADAALGGKSTAPLFDTPKPTMVIPVGVLQGIGSATLTEAPCTVPGIAFGAGEGGNPVGDHPFIRGCDAQASILLDGLRGTGA